MADKAIRILDNGQEEIVYAADLTAADKGCRYICCGKDLRNKPCHVDLDLVISSLENRQNYFRASYDKVHKPACEYDESPDTKVLSKLNRRGTGITIDTLLELLSSEHKKKEPRKIIDVKVTDEGGVEEDKFRRNRDKQLLIEYNHPKKLYELYMLLANKWRSDEYASMIVNKSIIDHRNISEYRKTGLEEGQSSIILCSRARLSDSLKKLKQPDEVILSDAFAYTDREPPLYFLFKKTKAAGDIIYGELKDGAVLAVFGKWYKHETIENLYVSDRIVQANQVAVIKKKDLKGRNDP